jgi:protein-L-isoaspartate(D-aspartate) O-methyltransferase
MNPRRSLGSLLRFAGLSFLAPPIAAFAASEAEHAARRDALVAEITSSQYGAPSDFEKRVVEAMRDVPRHLFVPEALRDRAYENRPLPIGHEQTISQPYIVALMTDLLKVRKGDRVLEVGTGSGYQAAVLARIAGKVYTIEIVRTLAEESRERLARLGYANVEVRAGDGYGGWPEAAPFDAIMVTAGAPHVPPALIAQLKPGGRMVIPVGPASAVQSLTLVEKSADGSVRRRDVIPVRFVPLTRELR